MKPYLKHIYKIAVNDKKNFMLSLFFMVVYVVTGVFVSVAIKALIDALTLAVGQGFSPQLLNTMFFDLAVFVGLVIVMTLAEPMFNYFFSLFISRNFEQKYCDIFYERLLRLDYSEHTRKSSSNYFRIFKDGIMSTKNLYRICYRSVVPMALSFFLVLCVSFATNIIMTLVALAVFGLGVCINLFLQRRVENDQLDVDKKWNEMGDHYADQISNIVTYKLNQDYKFFSKRGQKFSEMAWYAQLNINKKWALLMLFNADILGRFLILGVGVYFIYKGSLSVGSLFMFYGFLNNLFAPLHLLDDMMPEYKKSVNKINDFLDLLKQEDKVVDPVDPRKLDLNKCKGRIEFKNVFYAYNDVLDKNGTYKGDDFKKVNTGKVMADGGGAEHAVKKGRNVIKDVSFSIEPGERVALVGHSGSGKSTLMALVTRLYDADSGKILLDGVDIRKFKQEDYRSLFGVVLQGSALYNESIAENISYGKVGASRDEIVGAAKLADADEFISALPEGYDTMVGQRGVRLSGGEKQRISIARAILKNPKIVVLDEPTSALDSITEAKVQKGLKSLLKGRSALVIAHRLSTVMDADKIILLHEGEIVASGTHKQLIKTSPEYKKMVDLQIGGVLGENLE